MLGCKFSLTKFSLLVDHPQKLHTAKIFVYTVFYDNVMISCKKLFKQIK